MPIFMVERNFAEEMEPSLEGADGINRINDQEGVRWMYSFLSADKRKTYCLYEAPSPEAIRTAAARAGLPADVIVERCGRLDPDIRHDDSWLGKLATRGDRYVGDERNVILAFRHAPELAGLVTRRGLIGTAPL